MICGMNSFVAVSSKQCCRLSGGIYRLRGAVWYCTRLTGMHLWHSNYSPMIRWAHLKFCRRLIVVPLTTFHRLAELIGDPKGELIFLFNTARCGSTLVSQVVDRTIEKLLMKFNKNPRDSINFNKKLSYRRRTARCIVSVEMLPIR